MSRTIKKTCEYCGIQFCVPLSKGTGNRGKYCSKKCWGAIRDITVERVCNYCQATFRVKAGVVRRGNGKYCSRDCIAKGRRSRITCICQNCGTEFKKWPAEVKAGHGKFCSKKCYDETQWERVDVPCKYCGCILQRVPSRAGGFCSKTCRSRWMSENWRGENHPGWRGGHIEYGPNWLPQRKKALKRDNYTCQYCSKKKQKYKNHDVHHITPFRTFGYIEGENENYKQANELTNLITLCRKCHKKAESGNIFIQHKLL